MSDDDRGATTPTNTEAIETREWLESMEWVLEHGGPQRVRRLLEDLQIHARKAGVDIPFSADTPHINTIPPSAEVPYPGSREIERRIKSLVRWNAMAMVVRANLEDEGIGGHISTYRLRGHPVRGGLSTTSCTGKSEHFDGDLIYFQGHASPGIYARAFLEGRLSRGEAASNFRESSVAVIGGGLSSYPHPWLMPDFWEFPTVSMGLAPITAIYQARFNRYLEDRGLHPTRTTTCGPFSATAKRTSPRASAPSPWRPGSASTT